MEHDQRFKLILKTFFSDFLELFFADWAKRFDLSNIEWLDKELVGGSPETAPHIADMVARLAVREPVSGIHAEDQTPWLVLVHIEIESAEQTTRIKPRLPEYYYRLRSTYELPVLPIVIYLNMHLEGIGEDTYVERFWEFEVSTFRYLYVGLKGLDAVEYVKGENWLGVGLSALMRIPPDRVAWLGAEALRRLGGSTLDGQQRFLLAECVQAYLPLDDAQAKEYERLMQTDPFAEVRAMNQTVFEKGIEKGRRQEALHVVEDLLEEQFGEVTESIRNHLATLSLDDLSELRKRILKAKSLADLGLEEFK